MKSISGKSLADEGPSIARLTVRLGSGRFFYAIWQACVTHGACYALRW